MSLTECRQDMSRFWTDLTHLVCEGQPLLKSLKAVHPGLRTEWGRGVVARLAGDVQSGLSLSEAMKRQPQAFSRAAVCFVEGSELAGIPGPVFKLMLKAMNQCPGCGCWQMPKEEPKA